MCECQSLWSLKGKSRRLRVVTYVGGVDMDVLSDLRLRMTMPTGMTPRRKKRISKKQRWRKYLQEPERVARPRNR